MKNTTRYLNTIMRFRSDLQDVNERLRPEYEHIGRYRDSKSYPQNKKLLDDKRNAQVDVLRREAQEQQGSHSGAAGHSPGFENAG